MHLTEEVKQDQAERNWIGQRIGWVFAGLLLVAAAVGVFGQGPISERHLTQEAHGGTFLVAYDSWTRVSLVSILRVEVHVPGAEGDTLGVSFGEGLHREMNVRSSVPNGDGGSLTADGSTFEFQVDTWDERHVMMFEVLVERMGFWEGELTVTAGELEPVSFAMPIRAFP